ncbi:Predicted oxidoreductase [Paenibacillus sp. 1_12]|uniref:aldo/keto reductase n=1 Tax=Paenibacillus sp. 1_12 TaxID=1566278 RepID=UPI0008E2DE02|nr:aldo/keto reductase [Paenibacillus sp. 1_12]SFL07865.1 Predicted oxidoreductase [Paenibacillus sp. 1_12]
MDYVALGRTGLQVSVMSLGAGGSSRLGMQTIKSEQEAATIVKKAIELGINLIDTAEAYGTENVVGAGLQHVPREAVYISTKYSLQHNKVLKNPKDFEKSVDQSLSNLKTDYIDIYHLHGVSAADYGYAAEHLVPEMIKMQEKGKIRFLGITEAFGSDPAHQMLKKAIQDDYWDVMMVGFNLLNQSARTQIFETTIAKNIGVLDMFAVRRALSRPDALAEIIGNLIAEGKLDSSKVDPANTLDFLVHQHGAESIMDAAYRFCRYEPGIHSVLMGTGNVLHLADNIASANRPPLPEADIQRLKDMFGAIDSVTGN